MTIINVIGQKMYASALKIFAQGSQQFVKFQFNFSKEWNGLKIFAQFRQNNTAYNQYLDDENCVYLPTEIESGVCTLMLYGTKDTIIGTTNCLELVINENGFLANAESTEITESLYNQLIAEFNEFKKQITNFSGKSFVFDTEAHLLGWVGQNLCPMPTKISNAICEITHNDDGTFNVVANSTGTIPLSLGTITLSEGTYVFTRYNCDFFFGLFNYSNPIEENTVFVVEKDTFVQVGIYYRPIEGDNFKNAWIQITRGETIPETFVPYYEPYEREDGITNDILSAGDLLLTEESGKPAYWWDGTELQKLSASSNGGLVDLSNYYTKTEIDEFAQYFVQSDTLASDYYNAVTVDALVNGSIKLWQPNTEYKDGDVVLGDALYEGEFDMPIHAILECNENHTSTSADTSISDVFQGKWTVLKKLAVDYAVRASTDFYGNLIDKTYATKDELTAAIGEALEGDY